MNSYKEAKVSLYIIGAIMFVVIIFYFVASMFTSMGYKGLRDARDANADQLSNYDNVIIVIDAGHGGEDPGATANGLIEKELNLDISKRLNNMLLTFGYDTLLTRQDDILLYNPGEEGRKKYHDLRNREEIAENCGNALFVSIHINKFPLEACKGLQTFYSDNNAESIKIAQSVQNSAKLLQEYNNREVKCGNDSIYLMENLDIPAVLIECGFISNPEEAEFLSDSDYREALAFSIYCGISEYLEEVKNET